VVYEGFDTTDSQEAKALLVERSTDEKREAMTDFGDCMFCGGEVEETMIECDYRRRGQLLIISNVSAGNRASLYRKNHCSRRPFLAYSAHTMRVETRMSHQVDQIPEQPLSVLIGRQLGGVDARLPTAPL
jgi:hypothetical protein